MNVLRVSCLFLMLLVQSSMAFAQTVTIYTEEFPPFNFTENGKIIGMSTEVVEAVMKRSGVDYEIVSYPWARTIKLSQERPNALIYSISRRAKREELYQWIGEVVPSRQSIFSSNERPDITIETLEDLKKYKIGSTIEDSRETYLMDKGFDLKSFHRIGGDDSYVRNFQLLQKNRIDIWPIPDAVAFHVARLAGEDPDEVLRKVFELTEISQSGYYIAASNKTSKTLVDKIRESLEEFKATPGYTRILEKWGVKN